jgi:hypothetical protein
MRRLTPVPRHTSKDPTALPWNGCEFRKCWVAPYTMHGTDGEVEQSDGHMFGMRRQAQHYPSRVLLSRLFERPQVFTRG